MTLIAELLDIPEQVHKSDFVISLATAIGEPERTLADYVVTEQLKGCFDRALSLVTSAMAEGRSKATYLHASFGGGKTAMMAVLHLLLSGVPAARGVPELAPLVAKYANRLEGKRILLVPYHFIGASSMEQVVLGGYVEHLRQRHPEAALPAVFVADGIIDDARAKRVELGDEVFFRVLSEGDVADEWGDYGAAWDAGRFEAALAAPPGSSERDQLVGALLRTHYRAVPGQAQATAEGFVPLEAGLAAISRHAKGLGYDAVVLFLDELVLWLASRMSDHSFVTREGSKVAKLVEADVADRPVPIVSFIARQRDLRELVGESVPGAQALNFSDVLRYWEGRFDTITLEDGNLPAIAERRLLRPRSEAARQALDDAFEMVRRQVDERQERDVLLTDTGDLAAFRRLYPFSPALVDALVALSSVMQRERTALKVMLQLLVEGRSHLEVGQLVPLGDLFDAINTGDEPLTEVMRAQFAQARRLWASKLQPMLLRDHGLDEATARGLPPSHPYVTDARLAKSLLVAALVPEVGPLRQLTVSRLTALNSGIVRAFVPGSERQQVLDRLRRWRTEVGELRLGDDEQDPTVALVLSGIDTAPILDLARVVDNEGERRRKVRELLVEALQVQRADTLEPWVELTWRGTRRRVAMVFANVRDTVELPDEMLRAAGEPKVVLDYPFDAEEFTAVDDRARVDEFRRDRSAEWTVCWLPHFFTSGTMLQLGKLVRLDHVLTGDTFDRYASYLTPNDRAAAGVQLDNERTGVRERILAALRQAYGVDPAQPDTVEARLGLAEQYASLDPSLVISPPVGTSLRACLEAVAAQLYRHRYPKHPDLPELVSPAELRHTLTQVQAALQQPNGRLENVDPPMRKVLAKTAAPLGLGTMYQAHFIADVQGWIDLVEQRRAADAVTTLTVGHVRRWLNGTEPQERRGLTTEMADLMILLVAAATNRAVVAAGTPVARPELGRLDDTWVLEPQRLPDPATWQTALERAEHVGIVPASRLLTATTVADLGRRIHTELLGGREQAVRDLVPRLEDAAARLEVGDGIDRLRTARAAVSLVDELHRHPDQAAEVLARVAVPTSVAALGTSIKQAEAVAGELERTNWQLLRNATTLGEPWAADAAAILRRLQEALTADELVVGLVSRLRDAVAAATDLLGRAAAPAPPVAPTPAAVQPVPPAVSAAAGGSGGLDREAAERQLVELRERLRRDAHLELEWTITELPDADG